MSKKNRKHTYSPRGKNSYRALKLIGLLGFATVRQLCLIVWGRERTTNDNLNRFLQHNFLHEAYEAVDPSQGRANRIVFLTRTGLTWLLDKGHVREEDVAYYWRGEGHWHPQYNEHNIAIHNVLCAFIKRASEHPDEAIDMRLDPHAPLGTDERHSVISSPLADSSLLPDRIFALKYNDRVIECYLEVDMGTESKKLWQEKMEKYVMSPEVMDQSGVVVLTVAHTKRRMEALKRWSTELVDSRFLFSCLDEVCYAYRRTGKKLKLVREGHPFSAVWHTVFDNQSHLLFEEIRG